MQGIGILAPLPGLALLSTGHNAAGLARGGKLRGFISSPVKAEFVKIDQPVNLVLARRSGVPAQAYARISDEKD